jgi:hypothetical protein
MRPLTINATAMADYHALASRGEFHQVAEQVWLPQNPDLSHRLFYLKALQ